MHYGIGRPLLRCAEALAAAALTYAHVCSRMLTSGHVCSRMLSILTYADVCWRMLTHWAEALAAAAAAEQELKLQLARVTDALQRGR